MADAGKIPPSLPAWPARPAEGVVRRKRPAHDQKPKRDNRDKRKESPDDDPPHVDEYA